MKDKYLFLISSFLGFVLLSPIVFSAPLPVGTIPRINNLNARVDASGMFSDTENIGIGTSQPTAMFQIGLGTNALAPVANESALIKGNLEVDGKIYGDGSSLTNIATGLMSVSTEYGLIGSGTPGDPLEVDHAVYPNFADLAGYLTAESDPLALAKIGTLQNGSWCSSNGSLINCTETAPSGSGLSGLTDNYVLRALGTTNAENSIMFDDGANIGISTTTPRGKLEIQKVAGAPLLLVSSSGSTDGDYLAVTSAGNVGIGSTAPRAKLEVGTGATIIPGAAPVGLIKGNLEVDGVIYGRNGFVGGTTGAAGYWTGAGSPVDIYNNNAGNVGIGTSTSVDKLTIEGQIFLRDKQNNVQLGISPGETDGLAANNIDLVSSAPLYTLTYTDAALTASSNVRFGNGAGYGLYNGRRNFFGAYNAGYYVYSSEMSTYLGDFSAVNVMYGKRETWIGNNDDLGVYNNDGSVHYGTAGNTNTDNFYLCNNPYPSSDTATNETAFGGRYCRGGGDNSLSLGGINTTKAFFHGNTGGLGRGNMNVGINTRLPLAALDVEGSVYVGSSGNIGIGTASPRERIEVNGTIRAGAYKSSDGTSGVTVTNCTGFKNGLCISGT